MLKIHFDLEKKIEDILAQKIGITQTFLPSLNRITRLVLPLKNEIKKRNIKIITVAGSNGKGETAYLISNYLTQNNIDNALFISPHVETIRERFSYNMQLIDYEELEDLLNISSFDLNYFEYLFYLFLIFALRKNPKFLILEVGLGGRFDATNSLDTDCAVITSISRDHTEILGKTYRQILFEKLGVARENVPLFTAFELQYLRDLIDHKKYIWKDVFSHDDYPNINRKLALNVLKYFIKDKEINFSNDAFIARRELVSWKNLKILYIGAHNLDGMRKLVHFLKHELYTLLGEQTLDYTLVAFSKRDEKEINSILKILELNQDILGKIERCSFAHPKALNDTSSKSFEDFFKAKLDLKKNILIVGSFYFIGEVKKFLASK